MRRKTSIAVLTGLIVLAGLMLAGCSGSRSEAPALLRTVPSRSIEVMHFRHAGKALGMLLPDSTHAFRRLDLGRLEGSEMVLSYDYSSRLVPLLSLDAGRYRTDTSEAVKRILAQAPGLKLQAAYVVDSARRSTALLLTPSTAALSEALIHIKAGTSILDAADFTEALSLAKGGEGFIMLRHSAGWHLVPRGFLKDELPKGFLGPFLAGACKWTVLSFDSCKTEDIDAAFSPIGPERYYLSVFKDIKGGNSKIGKILPVGADFVVDLPLHDWKAFYEARCRWMDATAQLKLHQWTCKELGKAFGLAPKDWCGRICPQEVALVRWEGRSVTAVRCKKSPVKMELCPNPHPGYAEAIFGRVFAEPEGSVCSTVGKWLVTGSADDVAAFVELADQAGHDGAKGNPVPGKKVKFAVLRPGQALVCTDKGTELNLY